MPTFFAAVHGLSKRLIPVVVDLKCLPAPAKALEDTGTGSNPGRRLDCQKGIPAVRISGAVCRRHTCGNELWVPLCDSEEELVGTSCASSRWHETRLTAAMRFKHPEPAVVV